MNIQDMLTIAILLTAALVACLPGGPGSPRRLKLARVRSRQN
jgi:hypothetical protein